ncbi:uncharacterized protein LOC134211604 isoform X3 [Armigeres subalbatus]
MSSKGPKSKGSSGLRILWIPGRKKHNHKGVYNPTKKGLPQYQANQQRKNESWTLGGTVNHAKIINEDLHDNLNVGMASATGAMSLASMAASRTDEASTSKTSPSELNADGPISCSTDGEQAELVVLNDLNGDISKKDIPNSNQFDALELIDECEEKDRNYSNAESASSLLSSNNDSRSADYVHNAATLAIGETRRRRRRNSYNNSKKDSCENLDSIDHINDHDGVDAVKIASPLDETRMDAFRQQKKKNKKKTRPGEDDDTKDKDDKLVTCLYYSLVCWDCSIS